MIKRFGKLENNCPYRLKCVAWDDECEDYCRENYLTCLTYEYYKNVTKRMYEGIGESKGMADY